MPPNIQEWYPDVPEAPDPTPDLGRDYPVPYLDSRVSPPPAFAFSGSDLLAHFGVFAIQSFLLTRAYVKQDRWELSHANIAWLSISQATLLGVFAEIGQIYIPNRSFSVYDMIADLLGSITGLLAYHWLRKNLSDRITWI